MSKMLRSANVAHHSYTDLDFLYTLPLPSFLSIPLCLLFFLPLFHYFCSSPFTPLSLSPHSLPSPALKIQFPNLATGWKRRSRVVGIWWRRVGKSVGWKRQEGKLLGSRGD
uniref:Uncharacterized protein n=1 Tax=Cacopsylla melanoneura TaxID=428564 RepID=A0A8D8X583_9HEMI